MKSSTTKRFRAAFKILPSFIQRLAREAYELFKKDPYHPSLRFKKVHSVKPIYSVRIGIHYRAVGVLDGVKLIWFWIGSHADYDKLIRSIG